MAGTVIITGANGSLALGFMAHILSQYPHFTVIATVRNASSGKDENTAKLVDLVSNCPTAKVIIEALDLGRLDTVRSFAHKVANQVASKEIPRISAIICNAATWSLEGGQKFTADGYEATFQVCHLAHFVLVNLLLDSLNRDNGRIVMLGSITHDPHKMQPISSLTAEFPGNLEELVKPTVDPASLIHDRGFQRYATAKLANVTFALHLNKILKENPQYSKITVTAMDPGGLPDSRAQIEQKKSTQRIMNVIKVLLPLLRHFTSTFRTIEDAGKDLAIVSVDPTFHGKRGYFVGVKDSEPAAISRDVQCQQRLWEACWRWSGMRGEDTCLKTSSS
ncbi:hypothetical protein N7539_005880 [Penicillium diatomitis]|uniref:3beta-hydroxysteroid 3-dehydrogenase n=1 Tax=Penicillium diatomitis TaxID=2819901 RepID=A0A9W9X6G6_9EURO|nr:uncharacterized protein N7539_005880 [Penicillium diatomitis]KAJ5484084.1 hypothetical protein N7539_005880 [Penicillium diatomitis]